MTSGDAERRAEKLESHPEGSDGIGERKAWVRQGHGKERRLWTETEQLMEAVVERENMKLALNR